MPRKYPASKNQINFQPRNLFKNFNPLPHGASPERIEMYGLLVSLLGQTHELSQELKQLQTRLKKMYALVVDQCPQS